MEPHELQVLLRDLLLGAARPEIAVVRVLPGETLKVVFTDRSEAYVKVAELTRPGQRPGRPTYPLRGEPEDQRDQVSADVPPASMRPSYLAGLLQHLLTQSGHSGIVGVESFAEVGAVGEHWPPHGIRVTLTNGSVYLSVSKGSTTGGIPNDHLPEHFAPA